MIKPCPFCGSKEITARKTAVGWHIGCLNCTVGFAGSSKTRKEAVKKWDGRKYGS